MRSAGKLSAVAPRKAPPLAIEIAGGIAADGGACDGVGGGIVGLAFVGDGFAVEGGEQILPRGVFVGVGIGIIVTIVELYL